MKVQDFIPPIFTRALKKRLVSKTETSAPKKFSAYVEALEACSGTGYEDAELVELVFEKTRLSKEQMLSGEFPLSDSNAQSALAVLYSWQHRRMQKQMKVIDFGGACGAHYFQVRSLLPRDVQLDWMVVETPAMVEKAKAFETAELRFAASLFDAKEKLPSVDLLHSSGALQCVPDPQATIREFMACQPAYIFLNRLSLSASEMIITIRESFLSANGPGPLPDGFHDRLCYYPVTYFPKPILEEMLSQNYRTIIEFANTKTLMGQKEILANSCIFAERVR